jgi:GTP-binding protein
MIIKSSVFFKSSSHLGDCPDPVLPEYAFIGRSNVGKSSLINLITNKKNLAKISITPGKTQLINHFLINDEWYLVDLPGIGYARVSQQSREKWQLLISDYLLHRKNLMNTFMLIDARIKPQTIDLDFMRELASHRIPFSMLFTKTDKLTFNELNRNLNLYTRTLKSEWTELPHYIITSSVNKTGREEILNYISENNKLFTAGLIR